MKMIARVLLVAMIAFLSGCGGTPAPIDRRTSDIIAQEMMAFVAKKGFPRPLTAGQAVEALTEAFDKAGYSYSATLRQVASDGISIAAPEKFQFAMFMLMPVTVLQKGEGVEKYYSGDDLKAVNEIMRMSGMNSTSNASSEPSATTGYVYKAPPPLPASKLGSGK